MRRTEKEMVKTCRGILKHKKMNVWLKQAHISHTTAIIESARSVPVEFYLYGGHKTGSDIVAVCLGYEPCGRGSEAKFVKFPHKGKSIMGNELVERINREHRERKINNTGS